MCMQTSSAGSVSESVPAGLEEELLEAKQLLAEERGKSQQLAQHLASVEADRSEQEEREGGKWQVLKGEIRLLKIRMEQAIKERTDEVSWHARLVVCLCSWGGVWHGVVWMCR